MREDFATGYTFDNGNNILTKSITHPTGYSFGYSNNGTAATLTGITGHTVSYSYNAANRLLTQTETVTGTEGTAVLSTGYTYDANGNLTQAQSTHAGTVAYGYNALNQLTSHTAGGTVTSYGYDGTGMRVSKTQGTTVEKFYWDRGYVANESLNGTFTAENHIGAQGIFARTTGTNTDYLLKNGHGDVTETIRAGTTTGTYDYDAYGVQKSQSANNANPIRYSGEYLDGESGLIYLRNRYYDPTIGRFITEDPIQDGLNWYAYCGNNPVRFVDPSGLYYIVYNQNGTYSLKQDTKLSILVRVGATTAFSEPVINRIEAAMGRISGNSLAQGDAFEEGSLMQIRQQNPYLEPFFKVKDIWDASSMLISQTDIYYKDGIAFGLLDKAHIQTTRTQSEKLDLTMQYTYGFIDSLPYFTEGLNGTIFRGETLHRIDYNLSQSNNPQRDLYDYQQRAISYYISAGYDRGEAIGAANAIHSQLADYQERRNAIFNTYNTYMNILLE